MQMSDDTITIDGEHSTAEIKTTNVDETTIEQVTALTDHEAFRNPIRVMPDGHAGAGAVVGFTMPLGERICPNTVGVDIGCGMTALDLGDAPHESLHTGPGRVDDAIRERVPLGRDTFSDVAADTDFHMVNDFPWEECARKARELTERNDLGIAVDDAFGGEYFTALCERIGYSQRRAINSVGTLGGGNHFVEVARSEQTGHYWVVVHSGSRGIGLTIAEHWQERAHELCDDRAAKAREALADVPAWAYKFDLDAVSDPALVNWLLGGQGEDWKATDEISRRLDGEVISDLVDDLREVGALAEAETSDGDALDYLSGAAREGYLKDMVFAQTYAAVSRRRMAEAVADALDAPVVDSVVSTHNYIDFEDLVIRKGATRVHEGERGIIPFNMRDGAVLVRGKGNPDWHRSAPHGAGRRGSRRWAYDEFDVATYRDEMQGVYSSSVTEATLDEAPMAYKDTDDILARLRETATVEETLTPVLNVKAEE
jgi:tRNA-splicing ligase RtcB